MKTPKIKHGRVYKVFYLLQCLNGFIRVEEALPVLFQDDYKVATGDELWALDGFAGVDNVTNFYFDKENIGWWRKREPAEEALRSYLTENPLARDVKVINGKFRTYYHPIKKKEGYKNV